MPIVRRTGEVVLGLVSASVGVMSIIEAVILELEHGWTTDTLAGRVFIKFFLFVLCELFIAFGVAALLLSVRCILGPRPWISRILGSYWRKAVVIVLAIGGVTACLSVIAPLIIWLLG